MTNTNNTLIAVLALLLVGVLAFVGFRSPNAALGSVETGEEYLATTTFAQSTAIRTLKTGFGALGQVVITGDNTGTITIYNATTSDVSQRTGQKASSTIIIADFPASSPEGTYTFDAGFTDGLLVVTSGAPATSTILYR